MGNLGVLEAVVEGLDFGGEPGAFIGDRRTLVVATTHGRLRLVRVRPEGGRTMDAASFLAGRPAFLKDARVVH